MDNEELKEAEAVVVPEAPVETPVETDTQPTETASV